MTAVSSTLHLSTLQSGSPSLATSVEQVTFPKTSPMRDCELIRYRLQPGFELTIWRSHFKTPHCLHLHDDSGQIHFTCALQGEVSYVFDAMSDSTHQGLSCQLPHLPRLSREYPFQASCYCLAEGCNCINFTPGQAATASYHGHFEGVILSVDPNVLAQWGIELTAEIQADIHRNCCYRYRESHAEIQAQARALCDALKHLHQFPNTPKSHARLWFQGNSMMLISLILEQYQEHTLPILDNLTAKDHQRLLQARERLLSDLTQAPTIAMLAQETGLSVLKIKRGFRQVFGNSVYGLFQQERMKEAKRRLSTGNVQVVTVATDLGYANASHFTTAFQKHFGVKPSALKRGR